MIIASQLTDIATLVTAIAALIAAFGSSIAAGVGKNNKGKIEDSTEKVETVHTLVNNRSEAQDQKIAELKGELKQATDKNG